MALCKLCSKEGGKFEAPRHDGSTRDMARHLSSVHGITRGNVALPHSA